MRLQLAQTYKYIKSVYTKTSNLYLLKKSTILILLNKTSKFKAFVIMLLHDILLLMTTFGIASANTIFTLGNVSQTCCPDQDHPFSKSSNCKYGKQDSVYKSDGFQIF